MKTFVIILVGFFQLIPIIEHQGLTYDNYLMEGNKAFHRGEYKEALKHYARAKNACEDTEAKALNNQAVVYGVYGRYLIGIDKLTQAIAINNDNPSFYYNRAIQYYSEGQYEEAIQDFEVLNDYDQRSPLQSYYMALAYYKMGNYSEVIDMEPSFPKDHNAHYIIGLAHYQQSQFAEAKVHFEKAYKSKKELHYSFAATIAGHFTGETKADIFSIIEDQAKKEDALKLYLTIGQLALQNKNLEQSNQAFKAVISLDKNHSKAWSGLAAIALAEEKLKEASILYQKAWTLQKDNTQALNGLGNIANQQKNYSQAVSYFEKSLVIDSSLNTSLYGCALAHMGKVDPISCVKYLDKIDLAKMEPIAFEKYIILRAFAHGRMNKAMEAIDILDENYFNFSNKGLLRTHLAYYQMKTGKLSKAIATVGGYNYTTYTPYLIAGNCAIQTKQFRTAYQYFLKADALHPNHVDIQNGLAMAMVHLEMENEARQIIDSLSNKYPDNYYVQNSKGIVYNTIASQLIYKGNPSKADPYLQSSEVAFLDAKQANPRQEIALDNNRAISLFHQERIEEAKALLGKCTMLACKNNMALMDLGYYKYSSVLKTLLKLKQENTHSNKKNIAYLEHNIDNARRKNSLINSYKFITFYFLHEDKPSYLTGNPFNQYKVPNLPLPLEKIDDYILEESKSQCSERKISSNRNSSSSAKKKGKKTYSGNCPRF